MGTNLLLTAGLIDQGPGSYFSMGVITVCAVCLLMLVSNMLRRVIPFLRRSMFPTAVIAGLLGLLIKEIVKLITGYDIFDVFTLELIVYNFLPIGFIALCLRDKDDYQTIEQASSAAKVKQANPVKSGSLIVSTYLMQGIVGILVTVFFAFTFIPELNAAVGLILPMGFGQGPQQASNTGRIWDELGSFAAWNDQYNVTNTGRNFGITIAAFGFLWASIAGVILINMIAKKRGMKLNQNEFKNSGHVLNQTIEEADEVPLSESIDKFTLQICMVGAVFLATLGIIIGLEALLRLSGVKFLINLIPTIWGFGFMIAVVMAMLTKKILKRLFRKGVMKRKYPNSYMLNRISGFAFDFSITAALLLISVTTLGSLWWPILVMSTLGGLASIWFIRFLSKRIYKGYEDEGFIAMYGMLTGTISNGMILLREIDPNFKTPAADDLVLGSSTGIILGFPLLLLIAIAPVGNNIWWILPVLFVYMMALIFYQIGWFDKLFAKLFKKKVKGAPTISTDTEDTPSKN